MTNEEIIKLGRRLGLEFNENDNFQDQLKKNRVVFNGINGQRFFFDGKWDEDYIYQEMGKALILMGERRKKMEINRVLSITGD
jgi:hypothetical protein